MSDRKRVLLTGVGVTVVHLVALCFFLSGRPEYQVSTVSEPLDVWIQPAFTRLARAPQIRSDRPESAPARHADAPTLTQDVALEPETASPKSEAGNPRWRVQSTEASTVAALQARQYCLSEVRAGRKRSEDCLSVVTAALPNGGNDPQRNRWQAEIAKIDAYQDYVRRDSDASYWSRVNRSRIDPDVRFRGDFNGRESAADHVDFKSGKTADPHVDLFP